jgi:hypothetical protein
MVMVMAVYLINTLQGLLKFCKILLGILQVSRLQICSEALENLVERAGTLCGLSVSRILG